MFKVQIPRREREGLLSAGKENRKVIREWPYISSQKLTWTNCVAYQNFTFTRISHHELSNNKTGSRMLYLSVLTKLTVWSAFPLAPKLLWNINKRLGFSVQHKRLLTWVCPSILWHTLGLGITRLLTLLYCVRRDLTMPFLWSYLSFFNISSWYLWLYYIFSCQSFCFKMNFIHCFIYFQVRSSLD